MIRNEKGFTLAQVLVAAGLLAGLSLAFMQLMKNMGQAQNSAQSKSDEIDLRTSIRMILDDERFCRVSLAGDGPSGSPTNPVVFEKKSIDEESEGLDISLYLSNQAGDTRTSKRFNGENNTGSEDKSKFGRLTIKTLKLIMDNETGSGHNYPDNVDHNDIGVIRAVVEKKISASKTREIIMNFPINVEMSTGQPPESTGETRILGCKREISRVFYPSYTNCSYSSWAKESSSNAVECADNQVMTGTGLNVNGDNEYIRARCCDFEFTDKTVQLENCSYSSWVKESSSSAVECSANQVMTGTGLYVNGDNEYTRVKCCDIMILD